MILPYHKDDSIMLQIWSLYKPFFGGGKGIFCKMSQELIRHTGYPLLVDLVYKAHT